MLFSMMRRRKKPLRCLAINEAIVLLEKFSLRRLKFCSGMRLVR